MDKISRLLQWIKEYGAYRLILSIAVRLFLKNREPEAPEHLLPA